MTRIEAWNILSGNLAQLYKIRRSEAYGLLRDGFDVSKQQLKGYDDSDIEAETIIFMALNNSGGDSNA